MSSDNVEIESKNLNPRKKILDSSPMSGIAVPIAIILVGALIIFGVTKMLSTGRNHRDLINELHSKTFGNRWVAAYELSKFIASNKIPEADVPWMIENLSRIYSETIDARTRNFVVLALGALNHSKTVETLNKAINDPDAQVQFNAVVSLGNFKDQNLIEWNKLEELLTVTSDVGVKQAIILTFGRHQRENALRILSPYLASSEKTLRFSAALALSHLKMSDALPIYREILALTYDQKTEGEYNGAQVEALKVNLMDQFISHPWRDIAPIVQDVEKNDPNIKVRTKAQQLLNLLKN